uniref:Uncharacterized protein n=1 Tax=Arundo donax TaxID=35708 RepID=A0A0A9ANU0_ARUDO
MQHIQVHYSIQNAQVNCLKGKNSQQNLSSAGTIEVSGNYCRLKSMS